MDIYTELEIPHQMTIYEVYHTAKHTTLEAAAEYLRQIVEFDNDLRLNAQYTLACLYSIKIKHADREKRESAGIAAYELNRYLEKEAAKNGSRMENIEDAPFYELPYKFVFMLHSYNLYK